MATKAEAVFEAVQKEMSSGVVSKNDAFAKVASELGSNIGAVRANYYRQAKLNGTELLDRGRRKAAAQSNGHPQAAKKVKAQKPAKPKLPDKLSGSSHEELSESLTRAEEALSQMRSAFASLKAAVKAASKREKEFLKVFSD